MRKVVSGLFLLVGSIAVLAFVFGLQLMYEEKTITLRTIEVDTRYEDDEWPQTLYVEFEVIQSDEHLNNLTARLLGWVPKLVIFQGVDSRDLASRRAIWIPFDSEIKISRHEFSSYMSARVEGTWVPLTDGEIEQMKQVGKTIEIKYKKNRFTDNRSSWDIIILN